MCLKQAFFDFKWVLQAILSLSVLSNRFLTIQTLTPVFYLTFPILSVFFFWWIINLMRIPKICLKQAFFDSKWVLQAILSLSVLSNRVSDNSNFDTAFLPDFPNIIVCFFKLLGSQFNEDSKNVLKTDIF